MAKKTSKSKTDTRTDKNTAFSATADTYREVFLKSPIFTMIMDLAGNIVEWSETGEKKYGYFMSRDPVHFAEFMLPEEIESTQKKFQDLYARAKQLRSGWDEKLYKKDAAYREKLYAEITHLNISHAMTRLWNKSRDKIFEVEFNVNLLVDRGNLRILGFIVTSIDVTERNHYRRRLEESKEKYRELYRMMPIFAMVIDIEGKAVEFNYRAMEEYGIYSEDEVVTFKDFVFPEDHDKAMRVFNDLYTSARSVKSLWIDSRISREECYRRLRELAIWNLPIRLMNKDRSRFIEVEFSATLWISKEDFRINGALITCQDVSERNLYRHRLEESEKKYRELVEEKTKDIIFSLDESGRFITANRNMTEKLGYVEDKIRGEKITVILYDDALDKDKINREIFEENLDKIISGGSRDVRFNTVCNHKFLGEPVTLQFKLEPIIEDKNIRGVMGFATEDSDDPLRPYLLEESKSFELDNKLTLAEELSFKLTLSLQKYFLKQKVNLFRLGLREMLVNAIEHGNLGISYDEKTQALVNNTYQTLLRTRQNESSENNKKVSVDYRLEKDKVVYIIRDCGPGFDYEKILNQDYLEINEQMIQHGRGVIITKSIFDEMTYNREGNEVTLIAYLK